MEKGQFLLGLDLSKMVRKLFTRFSNSNRFMSDVVWLFKFLLDIYI